MDENKRLEADKRHVKAMAQADAEYVRAKAAADVAWLDAKSKADEEPYTVEQDEAGCERCGNGKTWRVIDPDGLGGDTSYGDKEDADEVAEKLNGAFCLGQSKKRFEVRRVVDSARPCIGLRRGGEGD